MQYQSHPLLEQEYIREQGVIVVEANSLPTGESPFQSDALVVSLCLSGCAYFDYNMEHSTFEKRELAVTLPNTVLTYSSCSPDYCVLLIVISKEFFHEMVQHSSFMDYKKYYYHPSCRLSEEQFENILSIIRVLRMISNASHPKRKETLENLLDILFYTMTRYRGEEGKKSEIETRNEQLFSRFYDLLMQEYRTHHDIGWYAKQLYLSPKYFSHVIRQTTEKSAAEWIDIVLVMQAKKILRTRRDLTIQQVAYELGFNENASFCRFFKEQTGLRPKEYREQ